MSIKYVIAFETPKFRSNFTCTPIDKTYFLRPGHIYISCMPYNRVHIYNIDLFLQVSTEKLTHMYSHSISLAVCLCHYASLLVGH